MSSVGKGVATASIGKILQARGYKTDYLRQQFRMLAAKAQQLSLTA